MSSIKLTSQPRNEFGKGAARRLRRAQLTPAVLYGHGSDPIHIALPAHDTFMALKHSNALFEIELESGTELAIAKEVQRDPIRDVVEHVDFLIVKRGEKVHVDVEIIVVGESAPGTMHLVEEQTLSVEAEATNLPTSLEVDITGREAGQHVFAGDVILPEGALLLTPADRDVITIVDQNKAASETADEAEETAEESTEG